MAFIVDAVSARHENDCCRGREHIFTADWAIGFQVTFNALMLTFQTDGHTYIALLAVEVVLSQSFSNTTNSAIVAVIYILPGIVVPQFTFFTIVFGNRLLALHVNANLPRRLNGLAKHTHHCHGQVSNYVVVADFIMAESARVPFSATMCLKLA